MIRAVALACAALATAARAAAQAPVDTFRLAPIVVTATGVPTPADRLPVTTTVLAGADLRARGIRTVSDALRLVPGATVVETNSYGSQTSVFLRGGESDYTKVLIDGVPQNAPGGAFDFADLSTDDIDRIEVVSGPVSVLYGSDAVSGVVQIFTRNGAGPLRGTVSAHAGTYGSADLGVSAAGGGERASFSLGLSRFTSDGTLPINNDYRDGTLSAQVRLRPDDATRAALSVRYGDALYHFPTDYTGAPTSKYQHQRDRAPTVGLDLARTLSRTVEVHVAGAWHRDNYEYAIRPNDSTDLVNSPYASSDWWTRQGLEGRAVARLAPGAVLTAGTAFEHQMMTGTTLGATRTRDDGAGFLELVTGLDRALSLTAGARLDDNQRFGTYATYRAGVSWGPVPATRLHVSVGTGFKEPSLYQNYATGYVAGNGDLRPEHSLSWEAGVERRLAPALAAHVTYFDQRFRDLIDYDPSGPVNYRNVPGSYARGLEAGVRAPLGSWGTVSATYTYLQTGVTQGDTAATSPFRTGAPLIRRPTHSATLGATAALPGGGTAGLQVSYVGRREDIDFDAPARVSLPPYGRVDLSARYPLPRLVPGLALDARVENALGARYDEVLGFPARGRTIAFGGSWSVGSH